MHAIKVIFSSIWLIFKVIWTYFRKFQSAVGTLLFIGLILFITASIFKGDKPAVPVEAALLLSLDGSIQEQKISFQSSAQAIMSGGVKQQTILRDVIKAITLATDDDRITMIILNVNKFSGGLPSKLHYIGGALNKFRAAGKKIITYGDSFSQGGYLIASYADEVYLNPYGAVLLSGYSSYQNYFKNFLDMIKADVQLFRVGKYKSAMEPFIRSDMSPAAKEASGELMGGLWAEYTKSVAISRGLSEKEFTNQFKTVDTDIALLNGDLAELAMSNKLVDGLKTREEWRLYLADILAAEPDKLSDKVIGYKSYLVANQTAELPPENIIAVVYANGTIMDGKQPRGVAGGDTVSRHLREARLNKKVKAVVLRVNSPGGSVFASELIRQEVLSLKVAGKPVVVSMGSLAASGGYWISANADEIWAAPTTITGSIGIFGVVPNFEGTLAAIGITTDGVGTTALSDAGVTKPLPEKLKTVIQSNIERGYERFLSIVAEGRDMTTQQVNEIAQGRVWTGNKALEIGLVDKLGSFENAVASAATRAELKDYKLAFWEDAVPWDVKMITDIMERNASIGKIFKGAENSPQNIFTAKFLNKLALFDQLNDPNHAYILCMSCMGGIGDDQ